MCGLFRKTERALVVFGNKQLTREKLGEYLKQRDLDFAFIKQVHGNKVMPAKRNTVHDFKNKSENKIENRVEDHRESVIEMTHTAVEADGQWTNEKKLVLNIFTADCLPIMITDTAGTWTAAVHAGWRGVENRIVAKALAEFKGEFSKLRIFIGPHIQMKSFEVETEVKDQLLRSLFKVSNLIELESEIVQPRAEDPGRCIVDLQAIVTKQFQEFGILPKQIEVSQVDTKSDSDWHSFRRDREKSGRNISFIVFE